MCTRPRLVLLLLSQCFDVFSWMSFLGGSLGVSQSIAPTFREFQESAEYSGSWLRVISTYDLTMISSCDRLFPSNTSNDLHTHRVMDIASLPRKGAPNASWNSRVNVQP